MLHQLQIVHLVFSYWNMGCSEDRSYNSKYENVVIHHSEI
jgi:hypothetical protein